MECFYQNGLKFECNGCSQCCRFKGGVVLLSQEDLDRLSQWAELTPEQFIQVYCRWIQDDSGKEYLCLKDVHSSSHSQTDDCIFWDSSIPGCSAYSARPQQCRTYPFWTSIMESKEKWDAEEADCPGINKGPLIPMEEIKSQLEQYRQRRAICR